MLGSEAPPPPPRGTTSINIFDVECPELEEVTAESVNDTVVAVFFHQSHLRLTLGPLLGKGGFGLVFSANDDSGKAYALKISKGDLDENDWLRLNEEVTLMKHFSLHPNTVQFLTAGRDEYRAYVVMERCMSKSALSLLTRAPYSLDEVLWIGYQLVATVQYMHRKGCIHRDLKPGNLLFDFHGNLKITDFGLASRVSDNRPRKTVAGTVMFMAPELANQCRRHQMSKREGTGYTALAYGKEVDVWSVGVVLFVLATREHPYQHALMDATGTAPLSKEERMLRAVCDSDWRWPPASKCPVDPELKRLIEWILRPEGVSRPTMADVLDHPIWNRRPITCPLTLMDRLGLIQHAPPPPLSTSSPLGDRDPPPFATPTHSRDTGAGASMSRRSVSRDPLSSTPHYRIGVDTYFEQALVTLVDEEGRRRQAYQAQATASMRILYDVVELYLEEVSDRIQLKRTAASQLESIVERYFPPRKWSRESLSPMQHMPNAMLSSSSSSRVQREGSVMVIDRDAMVSSTTASGSRQGSSTVNHSHPITMSGRRSSVANYRNSGGSIARNAPPQQQHQSMARESSTQRGVLVHPSPDKLGVYYEGRESATKWSLRPVVPLSKEAQEAQSVAEVLVCMNKHPLRRLTRMPDAYEGFDCNVCDRGVLTINAGHCMYRCSKCDYDVCQRCAEAKRNKDVYFICTECAKKFPTNAKLLAHSRNCRGPSVASSSPGSTPYADALQNSPLWDDSRPSVLDVQLPARPRVRGSIARPSSGMALTSTDAAALVPRSVDWAEEQHRLAADSMQVSEVTTSAWSPDVNDLLPEGVGQLSKRLREEQNRKPSLLPRDSEELVSPVQQKRRTEPPPAPPRPSSGARLSAPTAAGLSSTAATTTATTSPPAGRKSGRAPSVEIPFSLTEGHRNEPVGIAAQRALQRQASAAQQNVVIEAIPAPQLLDRGRAQPASSAKASNRQASSDAATRSEAPKRPDQQPNLPASKHSRIGVGGGGGLSRPPPVVPPTLAPPPPFSARSPATGPASSSLSGKTTSVVNAYVSPSGRVVAEVSHSGASEERGYGNPPPTNARPPAEAMIPASVPLSVAAAQNAFARSGSVTGRGSVSRMPIPVNVKPQAVSPLPRTGAFLALPKLEGERQIFTENFLGGPWVRFYCFNFDSVCLLHYCLQPGRFGALFYNSAHGIGTAVIDIHTKLMIYVPSTMQDTANRTQPHPHVQTFYDEEVRLMSVAEGERVIPEVVESIKTYISEMYRMQSEGLTTSAAHAAYIHQRERTAVPRDTKFAYVRKVFPDVNQELCLFRLSNLRSHVVLPSQMDIRWQSDRRQHVGSKFYVYADGALEPFVEDRTGTLAALQMVIQNSYRHRAEGPS